jgi:hypothetical protein
MDSLQLLTSHLATILGAKLLLQPLVCLWKISLLEVLSRKRRFFLYIKFS